MSPFFWNVATIDDNIHLMIGMLCLRNKEREEKVEGKK